jgi:hypothetical protein
VSRSFQSHARVILRLGHSAAMLLAAAISTTVATTAIADPTGIASPADPALGANTVSDTPQATAEAPDRTGGAYTSPTLLFIPAGAVPAWNVRVIFSSEVQRPSDLNAAFRPGGGAELGLPAGITLGAGTDWVGGYGGNKVDLRQGLSPYFQARAHLLGRKDGVGWQLGTSATYKFVGFEGDPGEVELAVSLQYRKQHYELGLQGVLGQDFGDSHNHDGEVHAYAVYRVIPELALGLAGQARMSIAPPPASDPNGPPAYDDLIGGAIASLTLGRFQVGGLGGVSTVGIVPSQPSRLASPGALGQLFATARF